MTSHDLWLPYGLGLGSEVGGHQDVTGSQVSTLWVGVGAGGHQDMTGGHVSALYIGGGVGGLGGHQDVTRPHVCVCGLMMGPRGW